MARTRTMTTEWYGKVTVTLWPHGDLELKCGEDSLYGPDHYWRDMGVASGYPECDGSLYVFDNFKDMPELLYFFDC